MNILNVTEAHGWSGGTNQALLTSKEFLRRGHNVTMVCPEGSVIAERASAAGIKVRFLEIGQDYDVFAALKILRYAREENADILHAHHPQAHAVCLIAKYFSAKPKLVVTRRVIFRIRVNPFSAIKYRSGKISHFVAVCNSTARELEKGGVSAGKISFIPSGIEFSRWSQARDKRKLSKSPPYRVGLIGHYAHFKGHDILLKAAPEILKKFPGTKFVFAGRDTDKLAETARSAGVYESCEILGERNDVPEILSTLHVFAMPSRKEGIATALMEAQAVGVPAVAASIGGIPDVMIDGETGILVPPENPEALAAGIISLLENPQKAEEMALKGYERVKNSFAIPVVVDRLEELYKRLTGKN